MWVVRILKDDEWEDVALFEWQTAARVKQRELREQGFVANVFWEE